MNIVRSGTIASALLAVAAGYCTLTNFRSLGQLKDEKSVPEFQDQPTSLDIRDRDPAFLTREDIYSVYRSRLNKDTVGVVSAWGRNKVLVEASSEYVAELQDRSFFKDCVAKIHNKDGNLLRIVEVEGGRRNCPGTSGLIERR